MTTVKATPAAVEEKRLRWRCRRGMRELDHMLATFMERKFHDLDHGEREAFSRLIGAEDDQLWSWLSGRLDCPDVTLRKLIDVIRATN